MAVISKAQSAVLRKMRTAFVESKAAPVSPGRLCDFCELSEVRGYFFFALARFSSIAAWAAARRATGTRKGEQLT